MPRAAGRRGQTNGIIGTGGGTLTYFVYDGLLPLVEVNGSGNYTGSIVAVNTVGANGLLSRRTPGNGASVFYVYDPQGNAVERLDGTGALTGSALFDAFGKRASTDGSVDPYSGYGGQWGYYSDWETSADSGATCLALLGHRHYDSATGRFITRDPIGYEGGVNLYAYIGNDVLVWIDPGGTEWIYRQKSGDLYWHLGGAPFPPIYVDTGGSGDKKRGGRNNPGKQFVPNVGPIPRGWYTIGPPFDRKPKKGRSPLKYMLPLMPDPGNDMGPRDDFAMHDGDLRKNPSHGCLIFHVPLRKGVWGSGEHRLHVVE